MTKPVIILPTKTPTDTQHTIGVQTIMNSAYQLGKVKSPAYLTDPEKMKYINALTAIWCTGDYQTARETAWKWNYMDYLTCDDLIDFATMRRLSYTCLKDEESCQEEDQILMNFIARCEVTRDRWNA